jgi:ribosomal protein S18 acetylase RimI-like enzyme
MSSPEPKAGIPSERLEIRLAEPRQVDDLLVLVSEFHQVAKLPFSITGTGEALAKLLKNQNLGFVLVSIGAAQITGYILISFGYSLEFGGRDAFVDELYVRPAFQRQGIGSALLREAEKLAPEFGVNALHLESDFDNPGATSLYESKGYHKHPRFLMTKWLNEASDLRE